MAGFVKFNPDDWKEPGDAEGAAKVAKPAKVEPSLATLATLAMLPPDVADGLNRLRNMAAPRNVDPDAWAEAVADALRLADEGWATKALALGWSPLDLFGAVTGKEDDPHADGLAVWLSGRKLVVLTDVGAVASEGNRRTYFTMPRAPGARLLWALSRGG